MADAARELEAQAIDSSVPGQELIGQTLRGTYRVLRVLDYGGMGVVLDAEHLRLHRRVAIKLIAKHLAADPDAIARFSAEAEIISQLDHPHIVQVFDYDATADGQPFLVMELLHGESLATRIDRERLIPMAESVRIAGQVASALAAAHAASIVHRDLKPANIFLVNVPGEPASVKLLDFGISRRTTAGHRITRSRDILGTAEYMAPEQAVGRTASADHRADEYALAVIVYEMLSGRPPFHGDDAIATLYQVAHEAPVPLSQVAPPWIPEGVSDVIQKAMSKEPSGRYPGVHEFADALIAAAGCSTASTSATTEPANSAGRYSVLPHVNSERVDTPAPDVIRPARASGRPPHPKSRPQVIGSSTVRAVVAELDAGLRAHADHRLEEAGDHVEQALVLAMESNSADAHEAVDAVSGRIERVLLDQLGGLRQHLAVLLAPSSKRRERTSSEAFLLSRIDEGATLEEMLDISPLPRLETLRELASLARRGAIGKG